MTLPGFLIGTLLASLFGTLFHFWRGGGLGRLTTYVIVSWVGFWLGHLAAGALGWAWGRLGPLNLGMATLGSGSCLTIALWLSAVGDTAAE